MTPLALAQLFRDPDQLLATDFAELEQLGARYPYSANLQLLIALHAELAGHPERERFVGRAAATTFDRGHLFDLLQNIVQLANAESEQAIEDGLELLELEELPDAILAAPGYTERAAPEPQAFAPLFEPAAAEPVPTPQAAEPQANPGPIEEPPASVDEPPAPPTPAPAPAPTPAEESAPTPASSITPDAPEKFKRRPISSKEELRRRLANIRRRQIEMARAEGAASKRVARRSIMTGDGAISVTLAEVFQNQGQYQSAIQVYEKLALANPEKGPIFAALIKELQRKLP